MSEFQIRLYIPFTLLILNCFAYEEPPNYYWRDYTGIIPEDAVVGGRDINDANIYIGEAYVRDEGVVGVEIYPGQKWVWAPVRGVKKITKNIKILCGPQENFSWVPVNATHLHLHPFRKLAVVVGHQDGHGHMNIGRISYEGETRIGKIVSFFVSDANLHIVDSNQEEPNVRTYELLIYMKKKS